jgi:hypothetical protein
MQGRVLEKLEEVLGVQKRMWLRTSKSWHASGARGGTAKPWKRWDWRGAREGRQLGKATAATGR